MASATLEEKINKIRQKNEEIRRRHEEVEADKQNAAKLNALVKMVPPTDWPERKEPPEFSNPPPPRSNGNSKARGSAREYRGQQQQYHAGGGDGKKTHVFADGDGPPPDPTYNFLADSEREERTREDSRDNDRFRGRGGPARGSSRRRGGGREGYSKEYRGSPGHKDSSKPEYEAWRAERNRIDEARISRQRTAEGNWRREWDNNKMNVEEDEAGATKSARLDVTDGVRKDHKEFDKWQADGNDHDSPRGRGGKQYISRGGPRGSHNNRVYQHSNSFEQFHGPVSPPSIKPPLSPTLIDERTVVATDKSIKVIVNHGNTPASKGPVMSVKVSSSSIAGTGRVGPRQKPRVLYSSQSESEIVGHEHEKFSGHKSPDDKANRVSFNRDLDEQQRYVPKSPHPQRKGESNSKSPYLTRKEFKYDSQQQRHGEVDPKSPYLQRKEIKDCPKSPHLQKKGDFTNRESHAQHKNNNSTADSFKSNHSQRRTSEKTKHDSQKFSGLRKFDDGSAPKPQRTNKRIDKSKNVQRLNSKEIQESNANEINSQPKDLGIATVEESAKNIANGNGNHEDVKSTINNFEKKLSENSTEVETLKLTQNEDNVVSKLNVNTETLSLSTELEKVHENVSEDIKLVDDSEPMILIHNDAAENPESMNVPNNETEKELIVENIETSTAAELTTSHSGGIKTDECNENVNHTEGSQKLPEITTAVQEIEEIETIIDNKTQNGTAPHSDESKTDECNENATSAVQEKVEIETIIENNERNSTTPHSGENKTEECNQNVNHTEGSKELPEITSAVQEKVEIETIIENNTQNGTEAKNIQDVIDDGPKFQENSIPSANADDLEKSEAKAIATEAEFEIEPKAEVTLEPEKITNEIEQARNNAESTSVVEKVASSHETEAHQVPNNIDKQVVKDTENTENPVI